MLDFIKYRLPGTLATSFQAFLLIEKLFGMHPFGHLPWYCILSPVWIDMSAALVFCLLDAETPPDGK